MRRALAALAVLALLAAPAAARPPTSEERGPIESSLRRAGYVAWGDIEVIAEGDRILVRQARKAEGERTYDVVVEPTTLLVGEEVPN